MTKDVLDRSVAFFDKSDSRDKIFKVIQNYSKVVAWKLQIAALTGPQAGRKDARVGAAKYRKLASSLSEFRSLMKMFKWLKNIRDLRSLLANPTDMSPGEVIDALANVADVGYRVGDNIEYLCKYKFLTGSEKDWESRSKLCQFYGYILAVILNTLYLTGTLKVDGSDRMSDEEKKKAREKLILDFLKDFFDLLRVASGRGHLSFVPKPAVPGFAGVMGVCSGSIGLYQVWQKA
eukprot:TRINITY_DN2667_c0_g1_i2.p1 TRINITY_DN2667_c0_g1~~TRINITY_DN2667_c0_g1_i2.p1  ORF type:complete len:254 (+),score=61.78 TRINITY_DN2667_c0_g1_i2:61-762(+)